MLFAACCCADASDANQITTHSTTEESFSAAQPVTTAVILKDDKKGAEPLAAPERTDSADAGAPEYSARSLTPEEKEAEKARLQQLVNSFAKKAVKGCPCLYIKESSGERCSTQYKIDKSLEYLIVVSNKDPTRAEVTCSIAAIQDIYSLVEDGEGCFPKEVLDKLSPEEKDLLLMIVYRSGTDKLFRFCLLEESRDSRDTFLECLRILCIYAQAAPSPTL
mmetsp:Transcript_147292/g.274393  ORF Transcript_147292/g.274393 Transcript_147292/m.274393 type:complete len:221 (+) Transcript_147292:130-792(+)